MRCVVVTLNQSGKPAVGVGTNDFFLFVNIRAILSRSFYDEFYPDAGGGFDDYLYWVGLIGSSESVCESDESTGRSENGSVSGSAASRPQALFK